MNTFFVVLVLICESSYSSPQGAPRCSTYNMPNKYVRYSDIKEFESKEYISCKTIDPEIVNKGCRKTHIDGCFITMKDGREYFSEYSCNNLEGQ